MKTLSGQVTLTDIRDSHVDINSVSGNVDVHNVSGLSLEVNSGSGRITYEGDRGTAGEYSSRLTREISKSRSLPAFRLKSGHVH